MWHNLASPPENLRYYKFSQSPADPQRPNRDVDLEENRTTLFHHNPEGPLPKVPEESSFSYKEAATAKQPSSSLRSTTREPSRNIENNTFDLQVREKQPHGTHGRQPSKSMLDRKQKSSVTLSHKNQSWVIREQPSRVSASSKNSQQPGFLQTLQNQEEAESFSEILANEVSRTECERRSEPPLCGLDGNCFKEMMATLREIRDISREGLVTKKKLVRLLQERSQISFLYEKEGSDAKRPRESFKKGQDRSFKKGQGKSTVKKLSKSTQIEERLGKVEERLRALSKRVEEDVVNRKTLTRTTKKSTSVLR